MALDITGQKFNKLTALSFSHKEGKQKKQKWLFSCECGGQKIIDKWRVIYSYTKSCGCLMRVEQEKFIKNSTTHGLSGGRGGKKPEYSIWLGIKRRCLKVNDVAYKNYGGRGIEVCDRWLNSFENFFKDVGERPSKNHSIDRINNEGHYEPSNCRWATHLEQGRNKRGLRLITIDHQTKCLTEWVEHLGLNQQEVNRDLYERSIDVMQILNAQ